MFQLKHYYNSAKKTAVKTKSVIYRSFALFMLGFMGGVQAFAQSKGAGGFSSATTEN